MSNEKQETIADIVTAMRNERHTGDASCLEWVGAKIRGYADRIEAAAKREREAGAEAAQICGEIGEMIGMEATREKSSRVGNAAKMRGALSMILGTVDHLQTRFVIPKFASEEILELKQIAESVLNIKPRNCDVLSKEEALEMLDDRSFSKEDTIEWLYAEAKGATND